MLSTAESTKITIIAARNATERSGVNSCQITIIAEKIVMMAMKSLKMNSLS